MDIHICRNSFKVRCRKTCFRRDRPKSSVTFSFMDADLRLCFFLSCVPFVVGCQFCTSVLASTCGFCLLSPDFRPIFVFRIMSFASIYVRDQESRFVCSFRSEAIKSSSLFGSFRITQRKRSYDRTKGFTRNNNNNYNNNNNNNNDDDDDDDDNNDNNDNKNLSSNKK